MAPVTAAGSQLRRQYLLKQLAFERCWLRAGSVDTQSLKNMFIATFRGVNTTRFHILKRQWVRIDRQAPSNAVPMQSAGEESCDAWPPPACSQSPDLLCCLVRRVALLAKEWLTEERKLFLPASAKLAHHATLTERGPWWTGDGANIDAKQLAPMEDTTITPMHTQRRHRWDSNPVGQSPSA